MRKGTHPRGEPRNAREGPKEVEAPYLPHPGVLAASEVGSHLRDTHTVTLIRLWLDRQVITDYSLPNWGE